MSQATSKATCKEVEVRYPWLFYALGGGLGHLTRAAALARVALRHGHNVRLVTNSALAAGLPLRDLLMGNAAGGERTGVLDVVQLAPDAGPRAIAAATTHLVGRTNWRLLVVDTFPRGLAGELAPLLAREPRPKVLVHRALSPEYVAQLDCDSVARAYHCVLVAGEPAPLASQPNAIATGPLLLLEPSDWLTRADARRVLGVPSEAWLVLVSASGTFEEIGSAARLAARLGRRESWPPPTKTSQREVAVRLSVASAAHVGVARAAAPSIEPIVCWPLLRALRGVDILIGSGGYHTVHEARATGTALIGIARKRLYDVQDARLSRDEIVVDEDEIPMRALKVLEEKCTGRPLDGVSPSGSNATDRVRLDGVSTAIHHIEQLEGAFYGRSAPGLRVSRSCAGRESEEPPTRQWRRRDEGSG